MDDQRTRALVLRRRSPKRVREMDQRNLHALCHSLIRQFHTQKVSDAQIWLMDCCISELEYRARRARRRGWAWPCRCELCRPAPSDIEDVLEVGHEVALFPALGASYPGRSQAGQGDEDPDG